MHRWPLFVLFAVTIGCRSTAENTDTSEDWWDVSNDSASKDTASTNKDTGKTGGKDTGKTGGKDTGNDDGKGGGNALQGTLNPEAQSGDLTWSFTGETGDCVLTYTASNFEAQSDCTDCSFAWQFDLSDAVLSSGAEDCLSKEVYGPGALQWGQGSTVLSEKSGVSYYALYAKSGENWEAIPNGFSWTDGGKSESDWSIYIY